jgi:hypothetical protein
MAKTIVTALAIACFSILPAFAAGEAAASPDQVLSEARAKIAAGAAIGDVLD